MKYTIEAFQIVGISVETTNENAQSVNDLGELWSRFYNEGVTSKITNKDTDEIYSIYTDYESDFKGKYTAIIGLKVKSLDNIPDGLIGCEFKGGKYLKFTAKGKMPDAIMDTWKIIWNKDLELKRKYTVDFEVYGQNFQNGDNSEVEIYIATD